jgi:hypothetical protein
MRLALDVRARLRRWRGGVLRLVFVRGLMKDRNSLRLRYQTGNVVRWSGALYIVAEIHDESLGLLPVRGTNTSCHPSSTWPTRRANLCDAEECVERGHEEECHYEMVVDPTRTVDTVEVVARDIDAWVTGAVRAALGIT